MVRLAAHAHSPWTREQGKTTAPRQAGSGSAVIYAAGFSMSYATRRTRVF